jgi:2'-5' RNA ligase
MIRSFVAIDVPDQIKDELREVRERLRRDAPERSVRWSRISGIHLTLKFLGDISQADLPNIKTTLDGVAQTQEPFTISVRGVGCFPNANRPRVVWVGVGDDTRHLASLQRAIEQSLVPLGFEAEKRAFHPHLTLGRAHRRARRADQRRLGEIITSADVGELGLVDVEIFRLMRSDLQPDGAVYTALKTFPLNKAQDLDAM